MNVALRAPVEDSDVFVDLDGTLIRTDLFAEAALRYLRSNPLRIFRLLFVLLRGPAAAKCFLARRVTFDPAQLPYEHELIEYLKRRKDGGCRIILATAAHWTQANRIARHLNLFHGVLATGRRSNLKGANKLVRIQEICQGRPFIYAGNSRDDRAIWSAANRAIFVNAPRRDISIARLGGRAELVLRTRTGRVAAFLREMRPHQWAKNILLLVPLLTSHTYANLTTDLKAVLGFLAFGLCASGNYFINDLLDLDADRVHATKRQRPLASGELPIALGVVGAMALPCAAFALSALVLPWQFTVALAAYFGLSNLYSFHLKRRSTADVMTLGLLYTIRVVAGAAAISVVVSSWLLGFSMFIFVSLAYLKRYIEVAALADSQQKSKGRGYSGADSETMFVLGIASATAATVLLALYVSSDEVKKLYREPGALWVLCFLMLVWSNRVWVGARRGKINDDPVVFALKDPISRWIGLAALLSVAAARLLP